MLGDSHIWGTEQTAPDGKMCNYPPRLFREPEKSNFSVLPSETTFPYYLDDWKETVNLGWPGAGIDTVRDRFVHHVFEQLEPDDVVIIYLPTANRTSYAMKLGIDFNDPLQDQDYLNGHSIEDYALSSENITKVNSNWHTLFKKFATDANTGSYKGGVTWAEKKYLDEIDKMNDVELKVFFNHIDTFLNLTFWNGSTRIYNLINTVKTIEKMANSKHNFNIFYVCDTNAIAQNKGNRVVKNIKKVLGEDTSKRVLQWNWNDHLNGYLMHKNNIKDKKRWIHKFGHFTKLAHKTFAESVKDKFNRIILQNEKGIIDG